MATKSAATTPDPFGPPLVLVAVSDSELIQLRAQVEAEMDRRGLAFSVGSLGEKLAIDHFNSTRGHPTLIAAPAGTKNVDALSRDGERYSIKTLLKARKTGTVYPDQDNPDRQLFEWLLVVHLRPDHGLKSIHRFSWEQFVSLRKWDKRMRAWYISPSVATLRAGQLMMNWIQTPHHNEDREPEPQTSAWR